MNVFYVAYYTAIRYLRNIMFVLFFTAAPLLMIYATTVGGGMNYEKLSGEFSEKIGYCSAEKSELSNQFSRVLTPGQKEGTVEIMDISSYEEGMTGLRKGTIDSFIYIDKAASDAYSKNGKTQIKVYSARSISAAKTMAEGFVNNMNGMRAVSEWGAVPETAVESRNMEVTAISTSGKIADINDAATLGNMLLFLFYGALLGSYSIINDVAKNTVLRFKCAPIKYWENITGKMVGNVSVMAVSAAIIILFSRYVLGMNWGRNIPVIVTAILLFLIVVNNLGVILAGMIRNIYICGLVTFSIDFFLVYGVMILAYAPGRDTTLGIGKLVSPHYYAYEAIMGSIYNSSGADVQLSMLVLAAGAAVTTAISFIAGRRRIG